MKPRPIDERRERDILEALKNIFTALNSLVHLLRGHDENKQRTPEHNPSEDHGSIPPVGALVRTVTDFEHGLITKYERDQQKSYSLQKRMLWAQWALFAATVGAVIAAVLYARVTQNQFGESQKQTKIAMRQLEASERPWLSVDAQIDSPLIFNEPKPIAGVPTSFIHGEIGAMVVIKFTMVNRGHSPAENVNVSAAFYPMSSIHESRQEQQKMCGRDQAPLVPLNFPLGQVIFPNDRPLEEQVNLTVSKKDIETAVRELRKGFNNLAPGSGDRLRPSVEFFLSGCVNYQSSFTSAEVIGSSTPVKWQRAYQAGFSYTFARGFLPNSVGISGGFDPTGPDVPTSHVFLSRDMWGFYAR